MTNQFVVVATRNNWTGKHDYIPVEVIASNGNTAIAAAKAVLGPDYDDFQFAVKSAVALFPVEEPEE